MNYRHAYHAGNIADIYKHSALLLCMAYLQQKPKPITIIETHAGGPPYYWQSPETLKTNEMAQGLGRLLPYIDEQPLLAGFAKILAQQPDYYPGSPGFIMAQMRPDDLYIGCELHPEEFLKLKSFCGANPQAQLHQREGYEALAAFVPPAHKRGLVLIDPPYEQPDEWQKAAHALKKATQKWPSGCYLWWYPIKDRTPIWRSEEQLLQLGLPVLQAELLTQAEQNWLTLNGSGLFIINPPFTLAEQLGQLLPFLVQHCALNHGADFKIRLLAG